MNPARPARERASLFAVDRGAAGGWIALAEEAHIGNFQRRLIPFPVHYAPDRKSREPKINLDIAQFHGFFDERERRWGDVELRILDSAARFVKRGSPHALRSCDDRYPMRQRGRQGKRRQAIGPQVLRGRKALHIGESFVMRWQPPNAM